MRMARALAVNGRVVKNATQNPRQRTGRQSAHPSWTGRQRKYGRRMAGRQSGDPPSDGPTFDDPPSDDPGDVRAPRPKLFRIRLVRPNP